MVRSSGLARRLYYPLAVVAGAMVLLLLLWMLSGWTALPSWGYDLRAYYGAGLRLLQTGTPYQYETLSGPFRPGPFGLYLYAPPPALLFALLTSLPLPAAEMVWLILRILLFGLTCALMPVSRTVRLAVLVTAASSAPVLSDLYLGNISLIVTLCSVLIWRWLDRPIGSAALALGITLRTPLALVFAWWALRFRWRPILWTAGFGLLLIIATLPFMSLQRWFDFVTVIRNVSELTGVPHNLDAASTWLSIGGPAWAAPLALFAGYVAVGLAVLWSLRRDRELSLVVTLTATLLLSPLLWGHYLTQLMIPAAFLASRGRWWGILLPLAGWIAVELVPLVVALAMLAPFITPDRGPRATPGAPLVLRRLGLARTTPQP
jgi:hypothetical protein